MNQKRSLLALFVETNRQIDKSKRNKLVREYEAAKFVQLNSGSGRGVKIFLDEIVYAGLGKKMDESGSQKHCKVM